MAINTRAKRQSAAHVGYNEPATPLPSGTINVFQRATVANDYGGITPTPPATGGDNYLTLLFVS